MPTPYDNFNLTQSKYIPQYHGAPIKEFGDLLAKREADYQKNVAAFDQIELAAANLNVNDADYSVKKQALDDVRGQIKEIADAGGAYEFAGTKARQMAKNFTGNQALKAAAENQATIEAKKIEYRDFYLNDKMSKVGYDESLRLLGEYSGVGEGEKGVYDTPELYSPVKYTNVEEALNKFGQGFKANMVNSGWIQSADGRWLDNVSNKELTAIEVEIAMRKYAENSPDISATLNEHESLTGQDLLPGLIKAQGLKLGFSEVKWDKMVNPYALAAEKAAMANKGSRITYDILQKVKGSDIPSREGYTNMVKEIDKASDELLVERNNLSINTAASGAKSRIDNINQQMDDLRGKKEALARINDNYLLRAFKEFNITNVPIDAAKQILEIHGGERVFVANYIDEKTGGSGNLASPFIQEQAKEAYQTQIANVDPRTLGISDSYVEQYPEYSKNILQITDKINQYYEEAAEPKTALATMTIPTTAPERKTLQAVVNSIIGTEEMLKGKSLGDTGVDVMTLGLTWVGTERGGEGIDATDAQKIHSSGEPGYLFNPRTGMQEVAFKVMDIDGVPLGTVSMNTPSLTQTIQQLSPDNLGVIVGPQLATITASISGTGTISLGGTQIKVTYLGNDKQAAMKGNYEVIYQASDGPTEPIPLPNNLAVMAYIKDLYLGNNQ